MMDERVLQPSASREDMQVDVAPMAPPPPPPPPLENVTGSAGVLPHQPHFELSLQPTEEAFRQQEEVAQEAYAAMTPEQQAAYWDQWQQYSASYYALPEQQQQPYGHAQEFAAPYQHQQMHQPHYQPQGEYPQYGAQYGMHLQQHTSMYNQHTSQQQQTYAQQGYQQPVQPSHVGQQYNIAPTHLHRPGLSSVPSFQPDSLSQPASFHPGPGMIAPPKPKKPAVPEWLRQEMLKRANTASASGAELKAASDNEDEGSPKRAPVRFSDAPLGSRWAEGAAEGHEARAQDSGNQGEGVEVALEAERQRMANVNQKIKSNLTKILMEVTDAIFDEVAREVWAESSTAATPLPAKPVAVIISDPEAASGGANLLGLGYGSDGSDEEGRTGVGEAQVEGTSPLLTNRLESKERDEGGAGGDAEPEGVSSSVAEETKGCAAAYAADQVVEGDSAALRIEDQPVQREIKRGERVWYIQRDENRLPAIVVSVDVTHPPVSYSVLLAGAETSRETERHRLCPMTPEEEEALRQEAEESEARAARHAGETTATDASPNGIKQHASGQDPPSKLEAAEPGPPMKAGKAEAKASKSNQDTKKDRHRSRSRQPHRKANCSRSPSWDKKKRRRRSPSRERGHSPSREANRGNRTKDSMHRSVSRSRRRSKNTREHSRSKSPELKMRSKDKHGMDKQAPASHRDGKEKKKSKR